MLDKVWPPRQIKGKTPQLNEIHANFSILGTHISAFLAPGASGLIDPEQWLKSAPDPAQL